MISFFSIVQIIIRARTGHVKDDFQITRIRPVKSTRPREITKAKGTWALARTRARIVATVDMEIINIMFLDLVCSLLDCEDYHPGRLWPGQQESRPDLSQYPDEAENPQLRP